MGVTNRRYTIYTTLNFFEIQIIEVSSGAKIRNQKMANFYEQRIERLENENLDMRGEILR